MAREQNQSSNPGKKVSAGSVLRQLLYGHAVSSDFFARNWVSMVLVVAMLMIYIAGKYTCQRKMEEVRSLKREIEIVEAERIRVRSDYMGKIRESTMLQMVDTLHLGLNVREYPPYIVETGK
jgi:hypothetical protein